MAKKTEVVEETHVEEIEVKPSKVAPLGKLATNDPFITALAAKLDEVIAHL